MTFAQEAALADHHQKIKNDRDEAVQQGRADTRKKLELEAKLYQDG
jgi:hypothetical protein